MNDAKLLEDCEHALNRGDLDNAVRALAKYQKRRRDGAPEPRVGSFPGDMLADLLTNESFSKMRGLGG